MINEQAFFLPYGNDKRKRFIITKGYFNRSALKYPFFHDRFLLPGIRSVTPHLLCKCHPVKGLTGSLAVLCLAGLEKQISG